MKHRIATVAWIAAFVTGVLLTRLMAAEAPAPGKYEYATIRWGGRDDTHVVRPGGRVEYVRAELRPVKLPDRTHDRAFYVNIVMNRLAAEGWEFAGMSGDEIVMKRGIR